MNTDCLYTKNNLNDRESGMIRFAEKLRAAPIGKRSLISTLFYTQIACSLLSAQFDGSIIDTLLALQKTLPY